MCNYGVAFQKAEEFLKSMEMIANMSRMKVTLGVLLSIRWNLDKLCKAGSCKTIYRREAELMQEFGFHVESNGLGWNIAVK